jgi:hypothetical protein
MSTNRTRVLPSVLLLSITCADLGSPSFGMASGASGAVVPQGVDPRHSGLQLSDDLAGDFFVEVPGFRWCAPEQHVLTSRVSPTGAAGLSRGFQPITANPAGTLTRGMAPCQQARIVRTLSNSPRGWREGWKPEG